MEPCLKHFSFLELKNLSHKHVLFFSSSRVSKLEILFFESIFDREDSNVWLILYDSYGMTHNLWLITLERFFSLDPLDIYFIFDGKLELVANNLF